MVRVCAVDDEGVSAHLHSKRDNVVIHLPPAVRRACLTSFKLSLRICYSLEERLAKLLEVFRLSGEDRRQTHIVDKTK